MARNGCSPSFIVSSFCFPFLTPLQLHEEDELIWNDGVAPETALDFDAPHVSKTAGLLWWLGGFAFFYSVWRFAKATGHPAKKPSVSGGLEEGHCAELKHRAAGNSTDTDPVDWASAAYLCPAPCHGGGSGCCSGLPAGPFSSSDCTLSLTVAAQPFPIFPFPFPYPLLFHHCRLIETCLRAPRQRLWAATSMESSKGKGTARRAEETDGMFAALKQHCDE